MMKQGKLLAILVVCISAFACNMQNAKKAATYTVYTAKVAKALPQLDADLDRIYQHSDFAYMEPGDRGEMLGIVSTIYEQRHAIRADVDDAGDLISYVLAAERVVELAELRDDIARGVTLAKTYIDKMSDEQRATYMQVRERLITVDKALERMRESPTASNTTETITSLIKLAAAVARTR